MDKLVVDASVAVKWVVPEELSVAAVRLRDGYDFAAPDILFAEIMSTLWKKVRRGEIPEDDGTYALAAFNRIELDLIPAKAIAAEAFQLSLKLRHPAYDCFYPCVAALRSCPLVTADKRLVEAAQADPAWAWLVVRLQDF
jgi:predicted nucleic acid-binding protein